MDTYLNRPTAHKSSKIVTVRILGIPPTAVYRQLTQKLQKDVSIHQLRRVFKLILAMFHSQRIKLVLNEPIRG